jgi:3-oxoadipate enol-lactonase
MGPLEQLVPGGPAEREVETPLGRWTYAVHGAPRSASVPDVVLLHGLFTDRSLWRHHLPPLARLGRVLVVDMPGHGGSDAPPPFDLAAHARAFVAALPRMGVERAILVGWSWGGALALQVALDHPEAVAAMVLLATTAEELRPWPRLKYRALTEIVRRFGAGPRFVRAALAPVLLAPATLRGRPEVLHELVRATTAVPREVLVRVVRAVALERRPALPRLGAIRVPVLVVCGREDRAYAPGSGERLASAIPGARIAWIESAGHLAPLERPDEVVRAIVPFVAERLGAHAGA